MDVKVNDSIARKEFPSQNVVSSDSIDLTVEEALKSPKDVLALGRLIASQLELASRGAVLEHWLAHHVAEILDEVDRSSGQAKADAEMRAVEVILKLWLHRRALPEPVDPLGGYRQAIEALGSLAPESNPWRRLAQSGEDAELLRDIFDALAKAVVLGLFVTNSSEIRAVTSEEVAALSTEENEIKNMLDRWLPFVPSLHKPLIRLKFLTDSESRMDSKETDEDPESASSASSPFERYAEDDEAALRTKIIAEIKNTRRALKKLLKGWESDLRKPEG